MITFQAFAPNDDGSYEWQDVEQFSSTDLDYAVFTALQEAWEDIFPMRWVDDGLVVASAFFVAPRDGESRYPVLLMCGPFNGRYIAEDYGY